MAEHEFEKLLTYLRRVPSFSPEFIGDGTAEDRNWWIKFSLDLAHPLAWHVVQEFGDVLNSLSKGERLPTVFMPVSAPPYLNGGPYEYLSWVIESKDPTFTPDTALEWLEGRLPRPVDDLSQWSSNEDSGP